MIIFYRILECVLWFVMLLFLFIVFIGLLTVFTKEFLVALNLVGIGFVGGWGSFVLYEKVLEKLYLIRWTQDMLKEDD